MNDRTDFKENAEITFADGTFLELSEKDFTVANNSVMDAAGSNGIPLGVALCRSIQIELMNDDDRFSDYDFFGARIRLYLTFALSETIERIEYGTFTVLTPETYGTTVIITALDDMYKSDKEYSTSLTFPATIRSMLIDACDTLGISLGTTSFLNESFVVQSAPTDITYRQLIGYIAMIAGGNARIDVTGRLRVLSYDFEELNKISSNIDGGFFNPWSNPVDLDGGDFATWNNGSESDGGFFGDRKDLLVLSNWKNLKVDTDDVVITGVQTTYTDSENEEHSEIYGVEGYVLSVENPLIAGNEESAMALIGNVMVGGRFRQFSGDLVSNPLCEFMDIVAVVDRKNNVYASFITDISFQFFGFTNLKNSAEPTIRNSAKTYSNATKTLVAAKKLVEKEKTAREQAIEQLAKDLSNSSGLFMTQEEQEDGSAIYYMHDKPTLSESMIVWKLTALAFAISTDGGKTYPYGFTVNGETVTRLLYAEGIDADYINTGTMSANRIMGGTLRLGGADNVDGEIEMLASDRSVLGKWNSEGFWTKSADYSKPEISYSPAAYPACGSTKKKVEIKIIGAIGADTSDVGKDGSYFTSTAEIPFELYDPDGYMEDGCPYWILSGKIILSHVFISHSTTYAGYIKRIICTYKTTKRTITLFDRDYSISSPTSGILFDLKNNLIENKTWRIENNSIYKNQRLKGQTVLLASSVTTSGTTVSIVEDLTSFSQLMLVSENNSNGNIVSTSTFPTAFFLDISTDGWINSDNTNYASLKQFVETDEDGEELVDTERVYLKTSSTSYTAKLYGIV